MRPIKRLTTIYSIPIIRIIVILLSFLFKHFYYIKQIIHCLEMHIKEKPFSSSRKNIYHRRNYKSYRQTKKRNNSIGNQSRITSILYSIFIIIYCLPSPCCQERIIFFFYFSPTILKSTMSAYLASVISMPKYLPKCCAISLVAQPRNPIEASAKPTSS